MNPTYFPSAARRIDARRDQSCLRMEHDREVFIFFVQPETHLSGAASVKCGSPFAARDAVLF